jgi:hypothetical protein
MARQRRFGIVGVAVFVVSLHVGLTGRAATQDPAPNPAASAAKASPELVGILSKELGSTPEQAAGAAGTLFGVAKSQLSPTDFSQVAKAVPGMAALLGAAPAAGGAAGTSGALAQLATSAGGLASAIPAFQKLGLKPEMVAKAIPVLTQFVTKSGGADVGSLLAGVLK